MSFSISIGAGQQISALAVAQTQDRLDSNVATSNVRRECAPRRLDGR